MSQKRIRARLDSHLVLWIRQIPAEALEEIKLKFTRSNPEFYKKLRLRLWLGNTEKEIRTWTADDQFLILPRGTVEQVKEILSNHSCCLDPVLDQTSVCDPVEFTLNGTLLSYQTRPVSRLVETGSGIIRGRCGSGKTVVLIAAIAKLRQPALVVVHTRALQEQWEGMISEWLGIVPGRIGGGKKPRLGKVTIATQKALWSLADRGETKWARGFGTLVADEIHHWAARTFLAVAELFTARYRIGASADETRKDGKQFLIYETFGPVVAKIDPQELIAAGRSVPTRMIVVPTEFSDRKYLLSLENNKTPDWTELINSIVSNTDRNNLILDHLLYILYIYGDRSKNKFSTAPDRKSEKFPPKKIRELLKRGGPRILLLTERVQTAREWVIRLRLLGIPSGLMIGGQENKTELSASIQGLKEGTILVGVGTSVADEGLNIPPLTHVFVTCPLHTHPKRLGQMIGRAARVSQKKSEAICYYFWDRLIFPAPEPEESSYRREDRERKFLRRLGSRVDKIEIFGQDFFT